VPGCRGAAKGPDGLVLGIRWAEVTGRDAGWSLRDQTGGSLGVLTDQMSWSLLGDWTCWMAGFFMAPHLGVLTDQTATGLGSG